MIPSFWRKIKYRYELRGTYCKKCGNYYYPPRNICPKCRRKGEIEEVKLPEKGKVLAYTVCEGKVIALIELENGVKILSQLTCKPEDVEDEMEVVRVFRKHDELGDDGVIYYGTKFSLEK